MDFSSFSQWCSATVCEEPATEFHFIPLLHILYRWLNEERIFSQLLQPKQLTDSKTDETLYGELHTALWLRCVDKVLRPIHPDYLLVVVQPFSDGTLLGEQGAWLPYDCITQTDNCARFPTPHVFF